MTDRPLRGELFTLRHSIRTRMLLWTVGVTGLLLTAVVVWNYVTIRDQLKVEARNRAAGLDHKSAQGRPAHVGLRAQEHVLQGSCDAGTEQGGRNYDQGPGGVLGRRISR